MKIHPRARRTPVSATIDALLLLEAVHARAPTRAEIPSEESRPPGGGDSAVHIHCDGKATNDTSSAERKEPDGASSLSVNRLVCDDADAVVPTTSMSGVAQTSPAAKFNSPAAAVPVVEVQSFLETGAWRWIRTLGTGQYGTVDLWQRRAHEMSSSLYDYDDWGENENAAGTHDEQKQFILEHGEKQVSLHHASSYFFSSSVVRPEPFLSNGHTSAVIPPTIAIKRLLPAYTWSHQRDGAFDGALLGPARHSAFRDDDGEEEGGAGDGDEEEGVAGVVDDVEKRTVHLKWQRELILHAWTSWVQQQRTCPFPPQWYVVPLHAVLYAHPSPAAATTTNRREIAWYPVVYPVLGGTLEDEMQQVRIATRHLPPSSRLAYWTRRWAEGDRILQWLHEHCLIVHGDAHPGNWFVDAANGGRLLLGDFGESRHVLHIEAVVQVAPWALRQQCPNPFALLAAYERLLFRFHMASTGDEKMNLGARLQRMDERVQPWLTLLADADECSATTDVKPPSDPLWQATAAVAGSEGARDGRTWDTGAAAAQRVRTLLPSLPLLLTAPTSEDGGTND